MAETGFTNMAGTAAAGSAPEIGIGMLGYAFMGKAHSNAFKKLPYMMYPPVALPKLVAIAGRNEAAVREAAARYGYDSHYTDWRKMIQDDRVQLFDNGGPNDLHAEPCILAAQAARAFFVRSRWHVQPPKPPPCWRRSPKPASNMRSLSTTVLCRLSGSQKI